MNIAMHVDDVTLRVGRRTLAEHVELAIAAGELHALMGPSGVGKSTLLWTAMGLMKPASGRITVLGETIAGKGSRGAGQRLRARNLGIVYQTASLIDDLSVLENVSLPLMLTRALSRPAAEGRARQLLTQLGIDITTATTALSGGEQQRVAVARAVASQPAVVLADEPTASLDEESAGIVMDTLTALCRQEGSALLMTTHDSRVAARADVTWHMSATGLSLAGRVPGSDAAGGRPGHFG